MKAIVQQVYGDASVLHFEEVGPPQPRPRDLVVRVKAISVNPVDAKVRSGGSEGEPVPNPPLILGWDGAGIVEAVGEQVRSFQIRDEVFFAGDITRPGCYAELVAVDERIVGHKPKRLDFGEAAAIPLTALTAWEGLIETMRLKEKVGDSILIVGGGGGVGSIAIQIAKQICGLQVIATASRPESVAFSREMGATFLLDHREDLQSQLRSVERTGKVPYVFSTAELTNFVQLVELLAPLGHICVILGGEPAQGLDVSGLFAIRGSLSFEFMFCRPRYDAQPEKQGAILNEVSRLLDEGILRSTITDTTSWRDVQEAHRRIESSHSVGKMVMTVD
jgi:zinc-binding alcohol dehydrogenase family protein